jgi:DNA polymerase-3 subunit gamma/tau
VASPVESSQTQENQQQSSPQTLTETAVSDADAGQSLADKRKALLEKSRNRVSSLSIQGIERKKEHVENKKETEVVHDSLPEKPFNQEELIVIWNKYVSHLKERGSLILASILNVDTPELKGTTAHLRFPNASMKEDLEKNMGQILEFLKRELQNYTLDIEITVDKSVQKKYVYTDQEKFQKLVEKNPSVDLLRQAFDLEF